jgi:NADH-quinone oxidoreductase subunit M
MGSFAHSYAYGSVAALGMVLGAVYMLWMYQRVFLGKLNSPANDGLTDIGLREKLILLPIIVMMFWIGIYSAPFLRRMDASIELIQQRIDDARGPYHVRQLQAPWNEVERAK